MTDDANDARDERLAARLTVEPLDDVTRARLVRDALAASEAGAAAAGGARRRSSRSVRWLAAAAAVVALVAGGVAVFARDDSGSRSTAARAPKSTELPSTALAVPNAAPQNESLNRSPTPALSAQALGALGEVGRKAALRRAVTNVLSPTEPRAAADSAAAAPAQATTDLRTCVPDLGRGRLIASGTGTVEGATVTVYVVERPNGDRVATAVDDDCKIRSQAPL
jgi:hypothetical protein